MLARNNVRRHMPFLSLLTMLVALVALLPGREVSAQQGIQQTLDNDQREFARGSFFRTSLGPDRDTNDTNDLNGAVQLAPVGFLQLWQTVQGGGLPEPLAGAGTAVIGRRLFVVGGSRSTGGPTAANSGFTYWANINQRTGGYQPHGITDGDGRFFGNENWLRSQLPAVQMIPECPAFQISERTRASVVALQTGADTGFLYVIGGSLIDSQQDCNTDNLTTGVVQVGVVNGDTITWRSQESLRSPNRVSGGTFDTAGTGIDSRVLGIESAAAVLVPVASNRAFLYVIGGIAAYNPTASPGASVRNMINRAVFYTQVNADGTFSAPPSVPGSNQIAPGSPWARSLQDVPLQGGATGLYEHTAALATTVVGGTREYAIVVAGGKQNLGGDQINEFVFRGRVDPTSGVVTWSDRPNLANEQVTLEGDRRYGLTSVAYNNKLYMIGGRGTSSATVSGKVQTAVHDDQLELLRIPNATQYFIGNAGPNVLPEPRYNAAAALMDALPPADNPTGNDILGSAWAFVVGGNTAAGVPSDSLFRGRLGGLDEVIEGNRTNEGWFYSNVFPVTIAVDGVQNDSRVLSVSWFAEVSRQVNPNADIRFQFRKVNGANPNCPDESVFRETDRWYDLDGDSGSDFFSRDSGENKVQLRDIFGSEDFIATCFQYRVRFLQNGLSGEVAAQPAPGGAGQTPRLFRVTIEKILPTDTPDIRLRAFAAETGVGGALSSFNVEIMNLNTRGINNTLAANTQDNGTFWVTLCTRRTELAQAPPVLDASSIPAMPVEDGQIPDCVVAFYGVLKYQMTPGARMMLQSGTDPTGNPQRWIRVRDDQGQLIRNSDGSIGTPIADVRELFSQPGNYAAAVLLDMWNYVDEGAAGEANNRGEEPNARPTADQPWVVNFSVRSQSQVNLPLVRR